MRPGAASVQFRSIIERAAGPAITAVAATWLWIEASPPEMGTTALLVALVAFSAYLGRLFSALVASAIVVGFFGGSIWIEGRPFTFEELANLGLVAVSCLASALIVSGSLVGRSPAILPQRFGIRRRSARKVVEVVGSVDAILWEADPQPFRLTLVSRGSERLLGISAESWLEVGFWENIIHPEDRSEAILTRRREISGSRDHELTYRVQTARGIRWLHDVATVITDLRGRPIKVRGRLTDITSQKLTQQRLATVYAAGQTLSDATTLEDAAPRILETVTRSLGWRVGALWRVNEEEQVLELIDLWHEDMPGLEPFLEATRTTRFSIGVGLPGSVWQSRAPAWIKDVMTDSNFPRGPKAESAKLHSAFGIPITIGGEMVGVMEFFSDEIHEPDSDLLRMLTSVGNQIGQRIERVRAEEELRINESRKSAILENAQDAIISIDQEGVIQEFNPAAEKLFGHVRDDILGRPIVETIIPQPLRERHLKAFDRYLQTGEPTIIGRRVEMPAVRADGSEILVQLTISVDEEGDSPRFTAFLRDITAEKKEQQKQAFLAEVSTILASSLEYGEVLRQVLLRTTPYFCDYAFIDALEVDGSLRRICFATGDSNLSGVIDEIDRYLERKEKDHPVERALETNEVQLVPLVSEWPEIGGGTSALRRKFLSLPIRSLMVVPLMARGKTLGVMGFFSSTEGRSYGHEEMALAEELARRVSLQLDNAIRYHERSRIARTLEASLLPSELPDIPGLQTVARYKSGTYEIEVGGDFYDVFPYGQTKWGIVIGDVSGKGAEAAALTALLRYTIRAEVMQEREPSRILAVVNDAVLERGREEQYCTIAYSRIDATTAGIHLTVVSGGHPLPYYISKGGQVRTVGRPGTALGLLTSIELEEEHLDLNPGDTVVFYTDGVVEARSASETFGENRLVDLLKESAAMPVTQLADHIVSSVTQFTDGTLRDDLAVLVIRAE